MKQMLWATIIFFNAFVLSFSVASEGTASLIFSEAQNDFYLSNSECLSKSNSSKITGQRFEGDARQKQIYQNLWQDLLASKSFQSFFEHPLKSYEESVVLLNPMIDKWVASHFESYQEHTENINHWSAQQKVRLNDLLNNINVQNFLEGTWFEPKLTSSFFFYQQIVKEAGFDIEPALSQKVATVYDLQNKIEHSFNEIDALFSRLDFNSIHQNTFILAFVERFCKQFPFNAEISCDLGLWAQSSDLISDLDQFVGEENVLKIEMVLAVVMQLVREKNHRFLQDTRAPLLTLAKDNNELCLAQGLYDKSFLDVVGPEFISSDQQKWMSTSFVPLKNTSDSFAGLGAVSFFRWESSIWAYSSNGLYKLKPLFGNYFYAYSESQEIFLVAHANSLKGMVVQQKLLAYLDYQNHKFLMKAGSSEGKLAMVSDIAYLSMNSLHLGLAASDHMVRSTYNSLLVKLKELWPSKFILSASPLPIYPYSDGKVVLKLKEESRKALRLKKDLDQQIKNKHLIGQVSSNTHREVLKALVQTSEFKLKIALNYQDKETKRYMSHLFGSEPYTANIHHYYKANF